MSDSEKELVQLVQKVQLSLVDLFQMTCLIQRSFLFWVGK